MDKLIKFNADISSIPLPEKFDYPFNYIPHHIAKIAAKELQTYLKNQTDFIHDFGLEKTNSGQGKMFGVLVVKNNANTIGYLSAFSGKLANQTLHKHFVPPVYDVLDPEGFYVKTEAEIAAINQQIELQQTDEDYLKLKKEHTLVQEKHQKLLVLEKEKIKHRRKLRKIQAKIDNQQNLNEEFYLREYEIYLHQKRIGSAQQFLISQNRLEQLKKLRKEKSALIQEKIFESYQFLNFKKETKNLKAIFSKSNQNIPAGTGDCCAPKLLQYAFLCNLTPIAMAEFWWGKPLKNSIRKHQNYYPACKGKCKPILQHMLHGMPTLPNPLIEKLAKKRPLEIVYEDEHLIVINKPHELLSVSGNEIKDSVQYRIQQQFPNATGPLLVHRLDMSTSGILLIAKDKDTHKKLQEQFISKTIRKRYVAILDGEVKDQQGNIELPLSVDFLERPKQRVDFENGKKALTRFEVIATKNKKTKIYFYPITGRTHQLRVHAAHHLGLNAPILGDDLYGVIAERLYLHAENIVFIHPANGKKVEFTVKCPF